MAGDGGEGGSGGTGGQGPDVRAQAEAIASRERAVDAIERLMRENYDLRTERRELREKVDELDGSLPEELRALAGKKAGEDYVVLQGDALEGHRKLAEIGKSEEIVTTVERGREAASKLAKLERQASVAGAAKAHGYAAGPLGRLIDQDGLQVELREEEKDGEKAQVCFVRPPSGEDGKPGEAVRLDKYAEEHWEEFRPALEAEAGSGSGGRSTAGGTLFPDQPGRTRPPKREVTTDDVVEQKRGQAAYAHTI